MKTLMTTFIAAATVASAFAITPASASDTTRGVSKQMKTQVITKRTPKPAAEARLARFQATHQANNYPGGNTATEWTLACYAEFGPDAKYPDAALLEKCLN